MKGILLLLPLLVNIAFAQNKQEAEKLVNEGIAYHDKGDFDGAIARYDKALALDKDNLLALAEKALSLMSADKYEESITVCKRAIETHPGENALRNVYVAYGNAMDGLKKTDQSIEIYNQGIEVFPEYYALYFNKGISLTSVKRNDEALLCFQKSAALNPNHASSHNAMGRVLYTEQQNIPAIFALCRFFSLEPQGDRAKKNLALLQILMKGNAQQSGEKSVTINLDPKMLENNNPDGKPKENNFNTTALLLSLSSALDTEKKNAAQTDQQRFSDKLETICASVEETKKDNRGFYWEYYVPYFIEMKKKKLIEPFSYIVFASSGKDEVKEWLESHQKETGEFFEWSKSFTWSK